MSGTAPRPDAGPCDERACRRPYDHRGPHLYRLCDVPGCENRARNAEERRCVRHEDRGTYDRYVAPDGSAR